MALIVLLIFFLIGLSIGIGSQGGLTFSNDTLSAWVSALATVCIAILTIFLAKETWSLRQVQLQQIEQIRKDSIKPSVGIFLQDTPVSSNFLDIHIINNGSGVAHNIKFTFTNKNPNSSEVFDHLKQQFSELSILTNGISSLGAGERRISYLLSFIELTSLFNNKAFEYHSEISISYYDNEGKKYRTRSYFNFSEYKGMSSLGGREPLHKISSTLEKIQKDINQYSSGYRKLKTDIYTSDDRKKERELWEQERNEFNSTNNKNS